MQGLNTSGIYLVYSKKDKTGLLSSHRREKVSKKRSKGLFAIIDAGGRCMANTGKKGKRTKEILLGQSCRR